MSRTIEEIINYPNQEERLKNASTKVVVGMSGGVDSSVCAALLKEQGYQVIGLFMKNWEENDEYGVCQASKEFEDVKKVCEKLDIPYYSIDFVEEYRQNVFNYFLEEYQKGFTPNPDILCNREIKFKVFYDLARSFGAEYLATGHYCQKAIINKKVVLLKGADPAKDQSYFLYTMKEKVLENVLFPVGHLLKSEVRELARYFNLPNHSKKDSTGICFIGERNFKQFLSQYLAITPGKFQTLAGEVVGEHSGVAYYTKGQRKGLGLGGPGEAWFVVDKDVASNIVYVERGENHPALFSHTLTCNEFYFVDSNFTQGIKSFKCHAKIRYRQSDVECIVEFNKADEAKVFFPEAQRAITERQGIVFYQGEICLGGATILSAGPSLYSTKDHHHQIHS